MKLSSLRLLFWVFALVGIAAPIARAQGTALDLTLDALVRPTSGLVGLTPAGALVRSDNNGVSFSTVRAADTPRGLFALAASGSTVIAMGDSGWFVRSTDNGVTYGTFAPSITPAFVGAINSLAFADGKWVAVGYKGSVVTAITSPSGTTGTWTTGTIASTSGALRGVTWTGARWVAVGGNGSASGYVFTSTDGSTWTKLANTAFPSNPLAPGSLNAVASDGSGKVLAVGYAGTMLYSTDGGLTYTEVSAGVVSEDLRSVLFRTGTQWVAGGDSSVLVTFNAALDPGVQANITQAPIEGSSPINALVANTQPGEYLYASEATPPVLEIGPISLSVAIVSNQLELTLVGGTNTISYHTETTTNLITWSPVSGSTQTYNGVDPVVWTYALPAPGAKVFYRAKSGVAP